MNRKLAGPAGWTESERRGLAALLAAMIPPRRGAPGLGDLDLQRFWEVYRRSAPPLMRMGLRATVWVLCLSPFLLIGRPRSFPALDADARDLVLARGATSRLGLLRQLTTTLKMVACLAYFQDPEVQSSARLQGAA